MGQELGALTEKLFRPDLAARTGPHAVFGNLCSERRRSKFEAWPTSLLCLNRGLLLVQVCCNSIVYTTDRCSGLVFHWNAIEG